MKKLIALLTVLCMLISCVGAFAEQEAEQENAVVMPENELTDDVSAEEEIAEMIAEPEDGDGVDAEAAEPEKTFGEILEAAIVAGRMLNANVVLHSYTDEIDGLKDIDGINIAATAQNADGVNSFTFDLAKGDDTINSGMIAYSDDALYVKSSLLGQDMYKVSLVDLAEIVSGLMGMFMPEDEELGNIDIQAIMSSLGMEDLSYSSLANLDVSSLDFSPMMPVLFHLMSKVTVTDINDTVIGAEQTTEETPIEETEEAAAEETEEVAAEEAAAEETAEAAEAETAEPAYDGIEATDTDMAMMATLTINRDDLSIIINAIAETITANQSVLDAFGVNADDFTAIANAMADSFDEDLAIAVGMSADGEPVYGCMDYTVDGGISYRLQGYVDYEEEGVKYFVNALTTGNESTEFVKIGSLYAAVAENSVVLDILQGDENDYAAGIQVTAVVPTEESKAYMVEVDLISVDSGIQSYPITVAVQGEVELKDADFAITGEASVSANEATDKLVSADFIFETVDAKAVELEGAIDLSEMDAGEEVDVFSDAVIDDEQLAE